MDRAIVWPCEREERTALRLGTRSRTAPAASHSMVQTTPPPTARSLLGGTMPFGPCHGWHCHAMLWAMPWTVDRDQRIAARSAGGPASHGPTIPWPGRSAGCRPAVAVGPPARAGRAVPAPRTGCGGKPWYGLSAGAGGGANPEEGGGGGGELGGGRGRRGGQQVVQHQARQLLPAQPWDGPRPTMGWPVPWDGLCPIMEWPALNHGPNHGTACAQPWDGLRCQP